MVDLITTIEENDKIEIQDEESDSDEEVGSSDLELSRVWCSVRYDFASLLGYPID